MPVLVSLHQLFHTDTCVAYIHALRWKERPLHCPRCHSHKVSPWGTYHYRPGLKRYRCKACRRTFNDLPQTLFDQSKRSLAHWILATFLLCLSCSSRRIARELGVHIRTSYRWCWWLRNAALSYEEERQLEGIVEAEADEMSSFVKKKAHKQWLWLAMDRATGQIIAYHVGDRSRHSARPLWANVPTVYREHATFYTDQYEAYTGVIPAEQHNAITKQARKTNHLERFNNTLRQRVSRLVRATLAFSKNVEHHIGAIRYFIGHYNLTRATALPL